MSAMIATSNQPIEPYQPEFQQLVAVPAKYSNHRGELCDFKKLKRETRENLNLLMNYTAEGGFFSRTPTLKKYVYKNTVSKIYNFTSYNVEFRKRELHIDNHYYTKFRKHDTHFIFYSFLNAIFLEIKYDQDSLPIGRKFILPFEIGLICKYNLLYIPKKDCRYCPQFKVMVDVQKFVSTNSDFQKLLKSLNPRVLLKSSPVVLSYAARIKTCQYTLINHTNMHIHYEYLKLEHGKSAEDKNKKCQVIAFWDGILCLNKIVVDGPLSGSISCTKIPLSTHDQEYYIKEFKGILKKMAFKFIWPGITSSHSPFYRKIFPKEIFAQILDKYIINN